MASELTQQECENTVTSVQLIEAWRVLCHVGFSMMRRTCFLPVFGSSWSRGLFADLGEVLDKRGNQLCSAPVWFVQPDQWSGHLLPSAHFSLLSVELGNDSEVTLTK